MLRLQFSFFSLFSEFIYVSLHYILYATHFVAMYYELLISVNKNFRSTNDKWKGLRIALLPINIKLHLCPSSGVGWISSYVLCFSFVVIESKAKLYAVAPSGSEECGEVAEEPEYVRTCCVARERCTLLIKLIEPARYCRSFAIAMPERRFLHSIFIPPNIAYSIADMCACGRGIHSVCENNIDKFEWFICRAT